MTAGTARISEDAIEMMAIERLEEQGYSYTHGATIAPDGEAPERESYEDVLLLGRVRAAIDRLNPHIPANARQDAPRPNPIPHGRPPIT